MRRHLETPDFDATIAAAFFDVEYLGAFFFRVLATFSHEGALVWGIDLPNDARNEARFVHVAPQGEWYFRPVSITTGGARSWVDAP